jgi:hypothetical protein
MAAERTAYSGCFSRICQRAEDILEAYKRPYNEKQPMACIDEASRQPIEETRAPRPARSGQAALHDGAANLFMMPGPLLGQSEAMAAERRTQKGFAHCLRYLAEERYPDAEKTVAAMDSLNTRSPASLYAAFGPEAALRIAQRFETHYTPKHGSWLNTAELETGVLTRQCLGRRIPAIGKTASEAQAWVTERSNHNASAHWQFTAADASIKLRHLYPSF